MGMNGSVVSGYDQYVDRMKARTKTFAVQIVKLCQALPKDFAARAIGNQLLRAATSVGANYRAVCRARTGREFTSKMRLVMEEADESLFWLEILAGADLVPAKSLITLTKESDELVAIFTSAYAKAANRSKIKPNAKIPVKTSTL